MSGSSAFARRLFLMLGMLILYCAVSASELRAQGQDPKVTFTKIQDLDPKKEALNRPVRQKWAVVVGISKFQDRRLNSDLNYSKTARRFYDYLIDPQAGRFRADHVRLLTDEKASLQNINNSFGHSWLGKYAEADDLVLVYIATRAFPTTDGNSYLCAYNCVLDNIYGSCISLQELMKALRSQIKAERVVLVLEAPYSGSAELGAAEKSKISRFNLDPEQLSLGKGLIILSSSKPEQLSWSDLFTDNLISSLKEKDGLVPLEEAFIKTRQKTEYDSVRRQQAARKQTPVLKSSWQGNDLVIGCKATQSEAALPESAAGFLGAEAHYLKANQAVIDSDLDSALKEYKLAIEADQELADARADYAVALGLKGNWQEAEVELRKAMTIKPDDSLYLCNYARILDKLGQKDEAKKVLQKAYLINPKDKVILIALADKAIAASERDMAMKLVDQALVLYPDDAVVHDRLCFLLSQEGRLKEAIFHAKKALEKNAKLDSTRLKLGALYVLSGDYTAAITEYDLVLANSQTNSDAHFLLAQALEASGQKEKASRSYARFLQYASASDPRRVKAEEFIKSAGGKPQT